jgi:hypothetical protein
VELGGFSGAQSRPEGTSKAEALALGILRDCLGHCLAQLRLLEKRPVVRGIQAMVCAQVFFSECFSLTRIALAACALTTVPSSPMSAHHQWADGSAIPAWVSQFCCGLADAHRLTVKQIHQVEGGWRVDGYSRMIPDAVVFPSEDENVWLFYRTLDDGAQMAPICFFVPQGGT